MEKEQEPSEKKEAKIVEERSHRIPMEIYENLELKAPISHKKFQFQYLNPQQTRFKAKSNTWDQFLGMLVSSRKTVRTYLKSFVGIFYHSTSKHEREEDLLHKR